MDEESNKSEQESILTSVKKLLGILEDSTEFDSDIIMNINSAINTLWQLGVGKEGFMVTSKEDTYADLLEDLAPMFQNVKMYLFFKTRLGFDPPQTQALITSTEKMISELEWRIQIQMDEYLINESLKWIKKGDQDVYKRL